MADMTKGQERGELHRAIWAIADELRGAVDGWDFKNYVLFEDYAVNSNKLGATVAKRNEKLVKLLNGVADMKLGDCKRSRHRL